MKNKFIRVLSPISLIVAIILDVATIAYGVFAIDKIVTLRNSLSIFFGVIEVFAIILGVLVTKELLTNGVIFRDDEFEFTGIDSENVVSYDDIECVETYQDTTASLTKNFVDRHALIIFTLKEDKVVTIDIGLTTKGTLKKITDELTNYIDSDKIKEVESAPEKKNIFKKK